MTKSAFINMTAHLAFLILGVTSVKSFPNISTEGMVSGCYLRFLSSHLSVPYSTDGVSTTSTNAGTYFLTAIAITAQLGQGAPGPVTVRIETTGIVPPGYVTNTAAIANKGVACISDFKQLSSSMMQNREISPYIAIDGSHLRLTLNKVHPSGSTILVGGDCVETEP